MTSNEILKADMLDILFDNRNKQYGAYTLRKYYHHRLLKALGISFGCMFLLAMLIKTNAFTRIEKSHAALTMRDLFIPPAPTKKIEPPRPQVAQASQAPALQKRFTDKIEIVLNTPHNLVPAFTDLDSAVISDVDGKGKGKPYQPIVNTGGGGTGEKPAQAAFVPEPLIQKEPEFPGGMAAWLNFLNRNLRTPDELQAGDRKTVMIRFQVAEDGSVTGFEVARSAGAVFDNEVVRVLKKMPKWKPAIQNGLPVSRYFTQPVTFVAEEE
jgi:protein TonB